ncbi:hypothetical protein [Dellaglioa algida]|uniref:Holin n=2 Tax=Dellaglioa algida TaxID=105612 RepID=A0A5C6M639_9LACO|nr:hypothetical protein [Dellaglioa algida]MDK1723625.1 hypothetical protein [Dellaglioa algida]TWW10088.1 hypothetical protein LABALGLTS371_16280 [Dellaglioa algida]
MKVMGMEVSDLAAITTVLGFGFGVITLLFKQIVVNPLTNSIDSLTEELNESKRDRRELRNDITEIKQENVETKTKIRALDEKIDTHINVNHD